MVLDQGTQRGMCPWWAARGGLGVMLGMGIWSQRWLYYVSFLITMSQLPTRTAFVKQLRGGRGGGRAGPWLEGHNIAGRANTVRRVAVGAEWDTTDTFLLHFFSHACF